MQIAVCLGLEQRDHFIWQFSLLASYYDVTCFTLYNDDNPQLQSAVDYQQMHRFHLEFYPYQEDMANYMEGLEEKLSEFDVIIALDSTHLYSYQALRARNHVGNALIVVENDSIPFFYEEFENILTVKREIYKSAAMIVATTASVKNRLVVEGVREARIREIPHCVNLQRLSDNTGDQDLREYLKLDAETLLVLCIGKITGQQSGLQLLTSIAYLKSQYDKQIANRIKVLFFEMGSAEVALKKRAYDIGIGSNTMFLKSAPNHYYLPILRTADVLLAGQNGIVPKVDQVAENDEFPFDVINIMALARPVLVIGQGLANDVIGNHEGHIAIGDYAMLADALVDLMLENEKRQNFGQSMADRIDQRFMPQLYIDNMVELLQQFEKGEVDSPAKTVDFERLLNETRALFEANRFPEVIAIVARQLATPGLPKKEVSECYRISGDCHNKQGGIDQAIRDYEEAIKHNPKNGIAFRGLGSVSMQLSQYDQAEIFFRKALKEDEFDGKALVGIGVSAMQNERFDEAKVWLQKAVDSHPENQTAIFSLCQLAEYTNDFSSAEAALIEYTEIQRDDTKMLIFLARIYHRQQKSPQCKSMAERVIAIEPDNIEAQELVAVC